MLIEPEGSMIPIYRQCELLDLARSYYYYRSCRDDSYNVMLTNLIDEQYTRTLFLRGPQDDCLVETAGSPDQSETDLTTNAIDES